MKRQQNYLFQGPRASEEVGFFLATAVASEKQTAVVAEVAAAWAGSFDPLGLSSVLSAPLSCYQALVLAAAVATTETALAVETVVVAVAPVVAAAFVEAVGCLVALVASFGPLCCQMNLQYRPPAVGASVVGASASAAVASSAALAVEVAVASSAAAAAVEAVGSAVEGLKVEIGDPRSQVVACVASVVQTYSISNGFSQYKLIPNENIVGIVLGANLFGTYKCNRIRGEWFYLTNIIGPGQPLPPPKRGGPVSPDRCFNLYKLPQ